MKVPQRDYERLLHERRQLAESVIRDGPLRQKHTLAAMALRDLVDDMSAILASGELPWQ